MISDNRLVHLVGEVLITHKDRNIVKMRIVERNYMRQCQDMCVIDIRHSYLI